MEDQGKGKRDLVKINMPMIFISIFLIKSNVFSVKGKP